MNSFQEMAVEPREETLAVGDTFSYTAPANSLTVIRMAGLKD